jgi:carbamoyl-phosphate synthase large subunit
VSLCFRAPLKRHQHRTENRENNLQILKKLNHLRLQKYVISYLRGKEIAQEFGFLLVIRPSFTLGGTGAAIV